MDSNYSREKPDNQDKLSYVIWTGDITPHDVWATTRKQILDTATSWAGLMRKHLEKDVPVFPVLGNHEAFPVNM